MKNFFNLIPSTDSCCILLYGYIGEGENVNSADITRELLEAEAKYPNIDARINSMGGDVFTGITIFNALRNSKANITIYIDGIAASMGSVIASCGKPVKMSRYARLMIHSISGGTYGTTQQLQECIDQITGLEDMLCDIYAARCKKTKQEIKDTYFDGKDHWLSAQEALTLGFVDEIYDTEPVPADSTTKQVYDIYQNRINTFKPQNNKNMIIELVKNRPSFAGCASDDDVLKRIGEMEASAAQVPTLKNEVTTLKAKNQVFEDKAAADSQAEITALVNKAFDEGRITEPQKATFTALLNADRPNGEAALKALPVKKRVVNVLAGGAGDGSAVDPWAAREQEIRNSLK